MSEFQWLLDECIPTRKGKKMSEKNNVFAVEYSEFETYSEALTYAQKRATKTQEDAVIWNKYATVKYPVPTFEVVAEPAMAAPAVA